MKYLKKLKLKHWLIIVAIVVFFPISMVFLFKTIPFALKWELSDIKPLGNNIKYVKNVDEIPYLYKEDENGDYSGEDFRVMVFTDTHLSSNLKNLSRNNLTIDMLKRNIATEKPDVVVITGDIIVDGYTKDLALNLAEMMEKFQVYWAPVLGNHEGEFKTALSREELITLWQKYDYCLAEKGDTHGYGNYVVNLKTAEDVVSQSLVFMDSGSLMSDKEMKELGYKKRHYDFLKQEQIDWYQEKILTLQNQYGTDTKSMLFIHIPLVEYNDAWQTGEIKYGEKREEICASAHNSGMFEAIKRLGSTQAVFSGHDHVNDFHAIYQDVHLIYVQKSGYASYDMYTTRRVKSKKDRLQGGNLVTISNDGSFVNQPLLNTRFS